MIKIYRAVKFKIQDWALSSSLPAEIKLWIRRRLKNRFNNLVSGIIENRTQGSVFNFRRNIHRLEKGLSRRPRKEIFALDYIGETVDMFVKFANTEECSSDLCSDTMSWGKNVLEEYFVVVKHTDQIEKSFEKFKSVQDKVITMNCKDNLFLPYAFKDRKKSNITYEEFTTLAEQRRSVRDFLDKEISDEEIAKAMSIASLSPSACNRQPFKFIFVKNKELVQKIAGIPGGIAGYEDKIPCIVVVLGDYSAYFDERDFYLPIIDGSQASMSLQFALETLGISSFCVNWPLLPGKDKAIKELIELKPSEFVIMLIGMGYANPEGMILYSKKRGCNYLSKIIH